MTAQSRPPRDRAASTLPEPLARALPAGCPELPLIERAYQVAAYWHRGQERHSGDPYITHPVTVATILAGLGMDHETVCAALLHDVIEDTPCTLDGLRAEFGDPISHLVHEVTNRDWSRYPQAWEEDPDSADERVLMLKLADRLHNMRTARFLSWAKQQQKSAETLQIFAPLARRLGMGKLSRELQEIAQETLRAEPVEARTVQLRVSRRTLRTAAVLLPAPVRARWLEEWLGELHTLSRRGRARFTAQLLRGIPRLAITLRRTVPRETASPAGRALLGLLRWLLSSNARTWTLLTPFVMWMVIQTGRGNLGDAVAGLITVPPVLFAGVEWLRARLSVTRGDRRPR
jgi:hypothetical protein